MLVLVNKRNQKKTLASQYSKIRHTNRFQRTANEPERGKMPALFFTVVVATTIAHLTGGMRGRKAHLFKFETKAFHHETLSRVERR